MKLSNRFLTSNVRYEIVGRLCAKTILKVTAVKSKVKVTGSRSEGDVISTKNEQNDNISIRNCKKEGIKHVSNNNLAVYPDLKDA